MNPNQMYAMRYTYSSFTANAARLRTRNPPVTRKARSWFLRAASSAFAGTSVAGQVAASRADFSTAASCDALRAVMRVLPEASCGSRRLVLHVARRGGEGVNAQSLKGSDKRR